MACCTGQTECNHIITIGYLKTFTNGLIKDSSGITQDVNLNALPTTARTDSYCPTYAQLTGGSLISNFINAGSHRWSQNVDGITINGNYDPTQCVKQEDLVATYTRFESLTITATPSTNISECGGSSVITYTYTLRKYVKSMNANCTVSTTSTTDTDTTDVGEASIHYRSNQTWASISKPTVTLAKNGTHDSLARTVTITGEITFRSTQHSTTATITQKALTGEYKYWHHTYEVYSYDDIVVFPDYFDCNGGDWEATGYYTNHAWDVYRWQDSCNVDYDEDTVNRNHSYLPYSELYSSGSVESIDCETLPSDYTHTETIDYHGIIGSWTQFCPTCGGDCPCGETCRFETIHSGGTIPCTGGSVDILYDYIVKSVTCDPSTGQRTETIVDSGEGLIYATVHADGCNKTSSPITYEYDVVQEAGPCCPTADVFTYEDVVIPCAGASSTSQEVTWTREHTNPDTTITVTSGTTSKTIPGATCNATSSRKLIQAGNTGTTAENANPAVYQAAGPCCPESDEYTFNDVTVDCHSAASKTQSVGYTRVHTNPDTTKITTTGTADKTILAVECNPSDTARVIQPGNTGATIAAANPKVTQNAGPCCCSCNDFGLGGETLSWAWNARGTKTKTYTAGTCISDVAATSSDNWFTVSVSNGNINVTPSENNTTLTAKTATITVSYKAEGSSCTSKTFQVSQDPYGCSCDDLTIGSSPSAWNWTETDFRTVSYTANSTCISDVTVDSSVSSAFTASVNTSTKVITVTPTSQNTSDSARTSTITVSYKTNGTPCFTAFTVTQRASTCSCGDLSIVSRPSKWEWDSVIAKTATYTINTTCITDIRVVSSSNWFTVTNSVSGSNGIVTITPSNENTTLTVKTAIITINYKSNGTDCYEDIDVSQDPYVCSCSDLTLGTAPSDWAWNETNAKTVSYTSNDICISNVTVSSSTVTAFTASVNTSSNVITVMPVGQNISESNRTATITVNYSTNGSPCSTAFTVVQSACTCNCSDLTVSPTSATWAYDSTAVSSITLSSGVCINSITIGGLSHFSASVTTNSISVKPRETNTRTTDIQETLTINYKSYGNTCTPKTVTLLHRNQGLPPCGCNNLIIT